ncbi:MAG: alpha-L-rhamnosidase, partial [Verrucomicrobia bacterium]|nr:alpha-L-rhamnosidase [Verrucomicrobiota bacterium]
MRTIVDYHPFPDLNKFWGERGRWPAKWIAHPDADGKAAIVQAFRCRFTLDCPRTVRVHVSADERYELYLDGARIGRGPERGDRLNWCFETYDLALGAGEHMLVARAWWLSEFGPSPFAQLTVEPGFVLAAEGESPELLNTGFAAWETKVLAGYRHVASELTWGTGSKVHVIGNEFFWNYERGLGDGWREPKTGTYAIGPNQFGDQPLVPVLTPAILPPMIERTIHVGRARHVQALSEMPHDELFVRAADHLEHEVAAWDALLAGQAPITIPPRTIRRVIIDLQDYYCAYTDLVTTGGRGSSVRSWWAEALYLPGEMDNAYGQTRSKGQRDEIDGKTFVGIGDTFEPDGGTGRLFNTLWWEAGRYVELIVVTSDEPLTIEQWSLRETHYPYDWVSRFTCSDARFGELTPIARRVMEMCSHETYMDCPYYEQMMYVGDTRLEVLTTYACCPDDRLPQKALRLFDDSRKSPGFTQSRHPSKVHQTIPPFSAWWVAMIHDYAMWRDDPAGVRRLLPGMRAVLDTFMQWRTDDGHIAGPTGWNFMDWVPEWPYGMPPDGDAGGVSGPMNFQLAWVYQQAAEVEDAFGEPELASLHRRRAKVIAAAAVNGFWNEERGLFADDLQQTRFSEHTQCLALLGDVVDAACRPQLIDRLFSDERLSRTTIYFTHYLFETCALTGRLAPLFDRLKLWFDLKGSGFKTTLEAPEPSRSDCHAWGAHPMFHYYATILGIRPASPGFASVTIRPQLGSLQWARGTMVHPKGLIDVDLQQTDGKLSGRVTLP